MYGTGGISVENREFVDETCVFRIDLVDGIWTMGRGVSMEVGRERKKKREGGREPEEGQGLGMWVPVIGDERTTITVRLCRM